LLALAAANPADVSNSTKAQFFCLLISIRSNAPNLVKASSNARSVTPSVTFLTYAEVWLIAALADTGAGLEWRLLSVVCHWEPPRGVVGVLGVALEEVVDVTGVVEF
jgi:hypothetical protein